jgi:hypothetical protein
MQSYVFLYMATPGGVNVFWMLGPPCGVQRNMAAGEGP